MIRKWKWIWLMILVLGCEANYTPKPKGYYQMDFPKKSYTSYTSLDCPFTFEIPTYAMVIKDTMYSEGVDESPCWLNIGFPDFNGQIHLSYKNLQHDRLADVLEDMHKLTSKHIPKANSIRETHIQTENNVSGLLYEVGGEVASAIQFYLTDSSRHFIRCALYFYAPPNADSIKPVVDFIREDILHMIDTWRWEEM